MDYPGNQQEEEEEKAALYRSYSFSKHNGEGKPTNRRRFKSVLVKPGENSIDSKPINVYLEKHKSMFQHDVSTAKRIGGLDRRLRKEDRESRALRKYNLLIKELSFFSNYSYPRNLRPGSEIMSQLGTNMDVPPSKKNGRGKPLRAWIPDTIVITSDKDPIWLYTCSKGIMRRTSEFYAKQILEQLGDIEYPKEVVLVKKTPRYDGDRLSLGNDTQVLDSEGLHKVLTQETTIPMSKDAKTAVKAPNRTLVDNLVLQRFIKSKGNKAHIIRTAWRQGKQSCSWTITNAVAYDDIEREPSDNLRLLNCMIGQKKFTVNVVRMTDQASVECEAIAKAVRDNVQPKFPRTICEMVVDTLRDDNGQLWFLQVKAYKLEEAKLVQKRIVLDRQRLKTHMRSRKTETTTTEEIETGVGDEIAEKKVKTIKFYTQAEERYKCKFCSCYYEDKGTQYMMTTQMILETAGHMKSRLPKSKYNLLFGGQVSGELGVDASRLYQSHYVCHLCYQLFLKETQLADTSETLAETLAVPYPPPMFSQAPPLSSDVDDVTASTAAHNVDPYLQIMQDESKLSPVNNKSRWKKVNLDNTTPKTRPKATAQEYISAVPGNLTICRLLIAIHELYDVPEHLFAPSSEPERPLGEPIKRAVLRFKVFGTAHEVPIDLGKLSFTRDGLRVNSSVDIRQMRLFPFFAENTPLEGPLDDKGGIIQYITEETDILLQLCVCPLADPTTTKEATEYKMIGQCHIPLLQFKSVYVKKTDMVMPLGFNSELCQLRVSIGMERLRNDFNGNSIEKLRFCKGIYVPEKHFFCPDPLSDDWISSLCTIDNQAKLRKQDTLSSMIDEISKLTKTTQLADNNVDRIQNDAYCFHVNIESARNLPLEFLWPNTLYAQYKLFGQWHTTEVKERQGNSFQFSFKHKHYFRFTPSELRQKLDMYRMMEISLVSPMTRWEAIAHELILYCSKRCDGGDVQCIERKRVICALEQWVSDLFEYQKKQDGKEQDVVDELLLVDPIVNEPLLCLPKWLRILWNDSKLTESITWDEVIFYTFVILRFRVVYQEMKQANKTGFKAQRRYIENRAETLLHPSYRRVVEPELNDKTRQLEFTLVQELHDIELANEEAATKLEEDGYSWECLLMVISKSIETVEANPVHESFASSAKRSHDLLTASQPVDRVAYGCSIRLDLFTLGEDTIDGTFAVHPFCPAEHVRRLSTCQYNSHRSGFSGVSSKLSSKHEGSVASRETPVDLFLVCPWETILDVNDGNKAWSVLDLMNLVYELEVDEKNVDGESVDLMTKVLEYHYESEDAEVTFNKILETEKKLLRLEAGYDSDVGQESETDGEEATEPTRRLTIPKLVQNPYSTPHSKANKLDFPSYMVVNLVMYPSVYISGEQVKASEELDVEQDPIVSEFLSNVQSYAS